MSIRFFMERYERQRTSDKGRGLCAGYKKFFIHIRKYLRAMATLLENGLPESHMMEAIKGPLVIR
jgi:sulfatase maturation enzyme AslB (radical SAM superfamily)